jgi:death-on-curing protein
VPDTYYLDFETVEIINMSFCGEGAGIRDLNGVRGIVDRPKSQYMETIFFPTVFDKAAALLHGFATTQYFSDGNKRTAFLSATVFLSANGRVWGNISADDAEPFLLGVAANKIAIDDVARWLELNSSPVSSNIPSPNR